VQEFFDLCHAVTLAQNGLKAKETGNCLSSATPIPPGKMPGSTAGQRPAATQVPAECGKIVRV
jgi:hypothetical protein